MAAPQETPDGPIRAACAGDPSLMREGPWWCVPPASSAGTLHC